MIAQIRNGYKRPLKALALLVGVSVLSSRPVIAQNNGTVDANQVRTHPEPPGLPLFHGPTSVGTLGYGPPGPHPGFQGFGLGYHLGYGYGGHALGVGSEGGYPFYGGPGYPRCEPRLRRIGGITPFPYFGGAGYLSPEHPNFFGAVGPLVADRPVVTMVSGRGEQVEGSDYGAFTGGVPNPEALFAPFTARFSGASSMKVRSSYSPPGPTNLAPETQPSPR